MFTLDDFIAAALIEPQALLEKFTVADLERFVAQDFTTVRWAYDKLAAQGASHAS